MFLSKGEKLMKFFSPKMFMAGAGIAIGVLIYEKFIDSYVSNMLP